MLYVIDLDDEVTCEATFSFQTIKVKAAKTVINSDILI